MLGGGVLSLAAQDTSGVAYGNDPFFRLYSKDTGLLSSCTRLMQGLEGLVTSFALGFSPHVERQARTDLRLRAHPVDVLLHLAIAPVAPLHRVRGRRQQPVIEKRQGFVQRGGKEFLQRVTEGGEPLDTPPQFRQSLLLDSRVLCFHIVREANPFLRPLKKKGFKEERITTMGVDDIGTSHDPGIQQEPTLEECPGSGRVTCQSAEPAGRGVVAWDVTLRATA